MGSPMRYQPQGLARLNQSPLRRGLVSYALATGKTYNDAADGVAWSPVVTSTPLAFAGAPRGMGLKLKGAAPAYLTRPAPVGLAASATQPITFRYRLFFNTTTTSAILSWGNTYNDGSPRYYARLSGSTFSIFLKGYQFTPTLAAQTEYIVTTTYDGSTYTLYINGVYIGVATGTWGGNAGSFFLGNGYDQVQAAADFILSDFAVWNRALSPAEVAADAQNPWAMFDAGSGSSAYQAAIASTTAPTGGGTTTTVSASTGTATAAGLAAAIVQASVIAAAVGAASIAGLPASVVTPTSINAVVGSASAAGQAASIIAPATIAAASASVSAAGMAASVSLPTVIAASIAAIGASGQPSSVSIGPSIGCSVAGVSVAGLPASIIAPATINASLGALSASGLLASVVSGTAINAATASAGVSGFRAQIWLPLVILAPANIGTGGAAASLIAQGLPASIGTTSSGSTDLPCLTASVSATGYAASVVAVQIVGVDITEDMLCKVVRSYVQSIASSLRVIRTPVNLASMPNGPYVSFTPGRRQALATTTASYTDSARTVGRAEQMQFQIDCYGRGARDLAETLSALYRDEYAVEQFALSGLNIAPLYSGDVMQMPFQDDADQYEERYSFEIFLQINSKIITAQQSCNMLGINILSVDANFHSA